MTEKGTDRAKVWTVAYASVIQRLWPMIFVWKLELITFFRFSTGKMRMRSFTSTSMTEKGTDRAKVWTAACASVIQRLWPMIFVWKLELITFFSIFDRKNEDALLQFDLYDRKRAGLSKSLDSCVCKCDSKITADDICLEIGINY